MAEGKLKLLQVSDVVHFSKRPGQQDLFHRLFSECDLVVSLYEIDQDCVLLSPQSHSRSCL